jgi:asparagine synthase (glutamine-hydrolysing)
MYALALYDPAEATLFLARDPFGIKPLYYAETPQGLVFASEPQAILKTGLVPRRPRTEAITELMQLQFTTGRETIFAGIKRVLPGETLVVRRGKVVERQRIARTAPGSGNGQSRHCVRGHSPPPGPDRWPAPERHRTRL